MLTELKIKSAKAGEKRYHLQDGDGLYLDVMTSGKRFWRCRYTQDGKRETVTLGEYPTVSLREARDMHKQAKIQPSLEATRFDTVANEWLQKHEAASSSGKEKRNIRDRLRLHIYPFIGDKNISQIKPVDVLALLQRLEGRGTLEMARRCKQIVSQIMRYAVATSRADRDVTVDLRGAIMAPKVTHHATMTNPREIGALLRAVDGYVGLIVKYAMQLQAYTFVRPGELRHAEWTEIEGDTWKIPAEKMKMRRIHVVPLSRQSMEIIEKMKAISGQGRYVFPSARTPNGSRPMSEVAVLSALRRMGYEQGEMTGHGWRSVACTVLYESCLFPGDAIERQLAHAEKNNVKDAYDHSEYMEMRRKMMQWYADYLDELRCEKTR